MTKPFVGMQCNACAARLLTLDLTLSEDLTTLALCCPQCQRVLASLPRLQAQQRSGSAYQRCIAALEQVVLVEATAPRWQRKGSHHGVARQIFERVMTPQQVGALMDRALSERAAREHAAVLAQDRSRHGHPLQA